MKKEELKKKWQGTGEEIISGVAEWRAQNPRATLREIEAEVDKRLAELRVRMIADAAMASESAEWENGEQAEKCPECGAELEKKGKKKREMQTRGGQVIELEREYGQCPKCGAQIFPPG
jgi:YgiT-type zinc finger domain-containing protein